MLFSRSAKVQCLEQQTFDLRQLHKKKLRIEIKEPCRPIYAIYGLTAYEALTETKDNHRPQEQISNLFSLDNKWMILKKKTLKKNPSNSKPISYSTEFMLDINLNNFVRKGRGGEVVVGLLKCYMAKVLHTDKKGNIFSFLPCLTINLFLRKDQAFSEPLGPNC